jgi:acylphosphatase
VKTLEIIVSGKVQGVYFRQSTKAKAEELGITGTVQNLSNGSVQVVASGESLPLEQLVQWCHHGPPRATVRGVEVKEVAYREFAEFIVKRG